MGRLVVYINCVWRMVCLPASASERAENTTSARLEGPPNIALLPVLTRHAERTLQGTRLWRTRHRAGAAARCAVAIITASRHGQIQQVLVLSIYTAISRSPARGFSFAEFWFLPAKRTVVSEHVGVLTTRDASRQQKACIWQNRPPLIHLQSSSVSDYLISPQSRRLTSRGVTIV